MLYQRIITSCIAIIAIFLLLLEGGVLLTLALFGLAIIGLNEFIGLTKRIEKVVDASSSLYLSGFLLIVGTYLGKSFLEQDILFFLLFIVIVITLLESMLMGPENFFKNSGYKLFAVLYVPFLLSHLILLRYTQWPLEISSLIVVWFVLVVIWVTDTAAFFVGTYLGRVKLAPRISPNKTWEGAFGGVLGAFLVSVLFSAAAGFPSHIFVFLGILLSIVGQLGDLMQSALKRNARTKDSGAFFPGHGGVLDRIDSLLLAIPLSYYFLITFWQM